MESLASKPGRIVVARFDEGEDLLTSLTKCADEHKIKSGWFNLLGGLKELSYGIYETQKGTHRNIRKKARDCFELLPTFGNITLKEGKTLIHAHIVVAEEEEMYGGHLMEGSKIYPFAEVFIQEIENVINRQYNDKIKQWALRLV